mmetsp:Transcript_37265/g.77978  ORF Transcript_37265/g.77978 Transcript_37265/m.77978 type:complete len:505 (-) Transcript_37265:733-2247(-)|eukprot:CAMPEP_0172203604 /NCGR_PEP_ID=MMETSP1050-20130122/31388_1 /TAXON_ID=233186 /ORGANISM="Cryptomonas curvata, Strain CCAP979/52" /LENGTH=504 /DNA_ID=CAMNT_0012881861 /DNA_START=256 /DNA_END=1770 /DNA_ORIENTATION=-
MVLQNELFSIFVKNEPSTTSKNPQQARRDALGTSQQIISNSASIISQPGEYIKLLRSKRPQGLWAVLTDKPSHVVDFETNDGGHLSFAVAFAAVGEFHYALSYRWEDMVKVDGVGDIASSFTRTPAHIVARGVWVDAINHLNAKDLVEEVVRGMAAVYRGSEVYPLYLNIRVPGAMAINVTFGRGYGAVVDCIPVKSLGDAEVNALVHAGFTSGGYCSGRAVDVLHMVRCSVRGWMWQELTFGRFPDQIDNVVGYMTYCDIITGGVGLRRECAAFRMRGLPISKIVQETLAGMEISYCQKYSWSNDRPSSLMLDDARAIARECHEAVMADTERLWESACRNLSNVNFTVPEDCVAASLAVLSDGALQGNAAKDVGGRVLAICQRRHLPIPVGIPWIKQFVLSVSPEMLQGTAKQVKTSAYGDVYAIGDCQGWFTNARLGNGDMDQCRVVLRDVPDSQATLHTYSVHLVTVSVEGRVRPSVVQLGEEETCKMQVYYEKMPDFTIK